METLQWKFALVVGASSGIGEAIARRLAEGGARVALVARRAENLESLCADLNGRFGPDRAISVVHDVRNTGEVAALLQTTAARLGGLDLVVYAAGIMPHTRLDEYPTEADVATVETNFSGAVAWLNAAAQRFAVARAGTIIGISSVAGDRGRKPNPVYGATKAGLNAYLESLRSRLVGAGVSVLTVKPGYVRTALIEGMTLPKFLPAATTDEVAVAVLDAAAKGRRVLYVPGWWRPIMLLIKLIPAPVFERLSV